MQYIAIQLYPSNNYVLLRRRLLIIGPLRHLRSDTYEVRYVPGCVEIYMVNT